MGGEEERALFSFCVDIKPQKLIMEAFTAEKSKMRKHLPTGRGYEWSEGGHTYIHTFIFALLGMANGYRT